MRRWATRVVVVGALLLAWTVTPGAGATAAPAKALCHVCRVLHGEAAEEPVRAVRTHGGKEYGFCSEDCAGQFVADPAAFVPPEFPRPAPRFALSDLAGRPVSSESLLGRVVLLDFWATWCAPCRKAIPELQALHDRHADRGFTVVGISIDEGGPDKVRKFLRSRKVTYAVAVDSSEDPAWQAFGVRAVPAAFLLDRRGRIVAQWTGTPAAVRQIEGMLDGLLGSE
jgi:peroxiredoxin